MEERMGYFKNIVNIDHTASQNIHSVVEFLENVRDDLVGWIIKDIPYFIFLYCTRCRIPYRILRKNLKSIPPTNLDSFLLNTMNEKDHWDYQLWKYHIHSLRCLLQIVHPSIRQSYIRQKLIHHYDALTENSARCFIELFDPHVADENTIYFISSNILRRRHVPLWNLWLRKESLLLSVDLMAMILKHIFGFSFSDGNKEIVYQYIHDRILHVLLFGVLSHGKIKLHPVDFRSLHHVFYELYRENLMSYLVILPHGYQYLRFFSFLFDTQLNFYMMKNLLRWGDYNTIKWVLTKIKHPSQCMFYVEKAPCSSRTLNIIHYSIMNPKIRVLPLIMENIYLRHYFQRHCYNFLHKLHDRFKDECLMVRIPLFLQTLSKYTVVCDYHHQLLRYFQYSSDPLKCSIQRFIFSIKGNVRLANLYYFLNLDFSERYNEQFPIALSHKCKANLFIHSILFNDKIWDHANTYLSTRAMFKKVEACDYVYSVYFIEFLMVTWNASKLSSFLKTARYSWYLPCIWISPNVIYCNMYKLIQSPDLFLFFLIHLNGYHKHYRNIYLLDETTTPIIRHYLALKRWVNNIKGKRYTSMIRFRPVLRDLQISPWRISRLQFNQHDHEPITNIVLHRKKTSIIEQPSMINDTNWIPFFKMNSLYVSFHLHLPVYQATIDGQSVYGFYDSEQKVFFVYHVTPLSAPYLRYPQNLLSNIIKLGEKHPYRHCFQLDIDVHDLQHSVEKDSTHLQTYLQNPRYKSHDIKWWIIPIWKLDSQYYDQLFSSYRPSSTMYNYNGWMISKNIFLVTELFIPHYDSYDFQVSMYWDGQSNRAFSTDEIHSIQLPLKHNLQIKGGVWTMKYDTEKESWNPCSADPTDYTLTHSKQIIAIEKESHNPIGRIQSKLQTSKFRWHRFQTNICILDSFLFHSLKNILNPMYTSQSNVLEIETGNGFLFPICLLYSYHRKTIFSTDSLLLDHYQSHHVGPVRLVETRPLETYDDILLFDVCNNEDIAKNLDAFLDKVLLLCHLRTYIHLIAIFDNTFHLHLHSSLSINKDMNYIKDPHDSSFRIHRSWLKSSSGPTETYHILSWETMLRIVEKKELEIVYNANLLDAVKKNLSYKKILSHNADIVETFLSLGTVLVLRRSLTPTINEV